MLSLWSSSNVTSENIGACEKNSSPASCSISKSLGRGIVSIAGVGSDITPTRLGILDTAIGLLKADCCSGARFIREFKYAVRNSGGSPSGSGSGWGSAGSLSFSVISGSGAGGLIRVGCI